MASEIDATKPVAGNASTSNVRDNFSAAETEINEFQRATEDAVTAGGTVNALTANFTNDVVLTEGVTVVVKATGANTTAATLNVDATGVKSVVKNDGSPLVAGDILSNKHQCVFRFDAANSVWILINHGVALVARDTSLLEGQTSAFHLARANHTGVQALSTVTGAAGLASPAFTGAPTAPTASVGDNDTSLATTEYVQQEFDGARQSLAVVGFQKLPGNLVEQWGSSVLTLNSSGDGSITFPTAFPTNFFTAVVCNGDPAAQGDKIFLANQSSTSTSVLAVSVRPNPGAVSVRFNWTAKGN